MKSVKHAHHPEPMADPPAQGRIFSIRRRPLLGDCAPSGRVRLDALARWMQDVAFADVEDAGVEGVAMWVLRRTRIKVARFPRFADHCEVRTFCSGIGRMWAERRTTVALIGSPEGDAGSTQLDGGGQRTATGANTPVVEAVALWVHLDPDRRLPSPLTDAEIAVYGASAGGRRVPSRLRHPRPDAVESEQRWSFRRTDTDLADHVNNAAYWEPLEDELLGVDEELAEVDAEIEFRAPAQPGEMRILASGPRRWLVAADADEVHASALLTRAHTVPRSN